MVLFSAIVTAIWLGILTSISPCPLATNIAAISFISKRVGRPYSALAVGILYAIGRSAAYILVAVLLLSAFLSAPTLSNFLQSHANTVMGPILIVVGFVLLGVIRVSIPGFSINENTRAKVESAGMVGALFLGILFALSFCPVSAALYFGSLIPLAASNNSAVILPLVYGVGTAIPVIGFSFLIAVGAGSIGRVFNVVTSVERWARSATGVVFVLVGVYFVLAYIFGIDI